MNEFTYKELARAIHIEVTQRLLDEKPFTADDVIRAIATKKAGLVEHLARSHDEKKPTA